mgnify:CR=1 FL=1
MLFTMLVSLSGLARLRLLLFLQLELAAQAANLHLLRLTSLLFLQHLELLSRLQIDLFLGLHDPVQPKRNREVDEVVKSSRHDN